MIVLVKIIHNSLNLVLEQYKYHSLLTTKNIVPPIMISTNNVNKHPQTDLHLPPALQIE